MVHLAVILIWRFGRFSSNRQIKITVVLSQVLINSNNEQSLSAKLNISQSVFLPKSPNLMSTKCTTHMVYSIVNTSWIVSVGSLMLPL